MKSKLPLLPKLLKSKIEKTGQTRGASNDEIYQNRVLRNSTVLLRYRQLPILYPTDENSFENGFIVLISPEDFFNFHNIEQTLNKNNLVLGTNCLVFYETRFDWDKYNPEKNGWRSAQSRKAPLNGNYVARVPASTANKNGEGVIHGFTTSKSKGAGIRLFEYASRKIIKEVRNQLEVLYWLTYNSIEIALKNGMSENDVKTRRNTYLQTCEEGGLLDYALLIKTRIIDDDLHTICPLCREKISADDFFKKMSQAEGREVPDLTVTKINLFHINELRYGVFNHKPYNLGWGHHHCNVVTRDFGIKHTLQWMQNVINRNKEVS